MKLSYRWCLLTALAGLALGACQDSMGDSDEIEGALPVPDSPMDSPLVSPNGLGSPAQGPNGLGQDERPDRQEPEAQPNPDPQPDMQPDPQPEMQPDPQPEMQPDPQPEMQPDPQPEMQPDPQPEMQPDPLMTDPSLSVREACKRACERLVDCEILGGAERRDCEDSCVRTVNATPEDDRITPDCRRLGCEDAQLCFDTVMGPAGALPPPG